MKKIYRLKRSEDFKKVLDERRCLHRSDSFSIFYIPNELTNARIGLSVSTKIGNAVIRTRVKRQLRAQIAQCNIYSLHIDVVIIVKPNYLKKKFSGNLELLMKAFLPLQKHEGSY